MRVKEFDVIIEKDESGFFVADVPELSGCHTQGRTKKEVLANIKEAIELYIEVMKEKKKKLETGFVGIEKVKVNA